MQTVEETIDSGTSMHAHLLEDMQEIDLESALATKAHTLWRMASPSAEMLEALRDRFSLDGLHIKDICNSNHPPHFTRLKNGTMHIILRFPVEKQTDDEASEITSVSILVDSDMCALIWPGKRFHRFTSDDLKGLNVDQCASKIIHMLVDYLLSRVYILREEMDEFEEECLADVNNADLGKLLNMRKEISTLARHARTNAIAIEKLMVDPTYKENLRLADAHEHMHRATAIAESKAEHALNVMQAAQSLLSQRLNEVMTLLAVITVVLTPMGIIAGIFGMNFTQMEVLANPNGFAMSVWGMLLLGAMLAAFFKYKKWW
ncbi:CorA family divalent cation transporter [Mariprofundus sp. KV]|uniref:magnesium transporter CorA family protein n=1 Tax=Mariprofundus sp. KV TaxID=2608715 RepID=UPI0015A2BE2E|nr:CorA family divalent cation transporter [Mariprofundus sp. KV]NWF35465.1 hypothetical protein [Mariprofundus sp. KV]